MRSVFFEVRNIHNNPASSDKRRRSRLWCSANRMATGAAGHTALRSRPLACSRRLQHVRATSAVTTQVPHAVPPHWATPSQRSRTGELGFSLDFYNHYSITHGVSLGRGQYGVVYRAQHRASARSVAVKIMTKDREDRTRQDHLAAIMAEVRVWRAVQGCGHVVQLEDVYEDDRFVYLVQQLCSGGDLRNVLQGGQLSEREAAQVMKSVLHVIHHCHTQQYLFGDIKPANFMLLHPHRASGCQQFPIPQGHHAGTEHLSDASITSSETIHEHVLANLAPSPTAPYANLPRPSSPPLDLASSSTSASMSSSDGDDAAPAASQIANSIVSATPGLRLTRRPISIVAPQHTAAAIHADIAAAVQGSAGPAGSPAAAPFTRLLSAGGFVSEGSSAVSSVTAAAAVPPAGQASHGSSPAPEWLSLGSSPASAPSSPAPAWLRLLQDAQCVDMCAVTAGGVGCVTTPDKCGVTCQGELTVLATDFGCSQQLQASRRRGAVCAKRIGSPVYMAPELWQAGARVGMGVDVWAAGVMLYQLLSGRYPFWSLSPHEIDHGGMQLFQVVCGVSSNPIHFSGQPWAAISQPCKALIRAMLDRDPNHRISAYQALCHPWFKQQLGYAPVPPSPPITSSVDSDDNN